MNINPNTVLMNTANAGHLPSHQIQIYDPTKQHQQQLHSSLLPSTTATTASAASSKRSSNHTINHIQSSIDHHIIVIDQEIHTLNTHIRHILKPQQQHTSLYGVLDVNGYIHDQLHDEKNKKEKSSHHHHHHDDAVAEKSIYIPLQPYVTKKQRYTLEARLHREDPYQYIWYHPIYHHHTNNNNNDNNNDSSHHTIPSHSTHHLIIEPSPLQIHPSMLLRPCTLYEYIDTYPYKHQHHSENTHNQLMSTQLATMYIGNDIWYTLNLQFSALQFHSHPLFTIEDVYTREIQNLYDEYKRRETVNLYQFYTDRIQQLRIHASTLTHQLNQLTSSTASTTTSSHTSTHQHQLHLSKQLLHILYELRDARELRDRDEYEHRMLFKNMYEKWCKLRQWRIQQTHLMNDRNRKSQMNHVNNHTTPMMMNIHESVNDKGQPVNQAISSNNNNNVNVNHVNSSISSALATQPNIQQPPPSSPPPAPTTTINNNSTTTTSTTAMSSSSSVNPNDVYMGVPCILKVRKIVMDTRVDQKEWSTDILYELDECHQIYELSLFREKLEQHRRDVVHGQSDVVNRWDTIKQSMYERIDSRMKRCRRLPGQPIYIPILDTTSRITPTPLCLPTEQQRRKYIETSSYFIALYINGQQVVKEHPQPSVYMEYPSFTLTFNSTIQIRLLSQPTQILCKLYQKRMIHHEHIADIYLPVPPAATTSSPSSSSSIPHQNNVLNPPLMSRNHASSYDFSGHTPMDSPTYETSLNGQYMNGTIYASIEYMRTHTHTSKDGTDTDGSSMLVASESSSDIDDELAINMRDNMTYALQLQQQAVHSVATKLLRHALHKHIYSMKHIHYTHSDGNTHLLYSMDPNDPANMDVMEYIRRQQVQQKLLSHDDTVNPSLNTTTTSASSHTPTFSVRGMSQTLTLIHESIRYHRMSRRNVLLNRGLYDRNHHLDESIVPAYDILQNRQPAASYGDDDEDREINEYDQMLSYLSTTSSSSSSSTDNLHDLVNESALPSWNYTSIDWLSLLFNPSIHYTRILNNYRSWRLPWTYQHQQVSSSLLPPPPPPALQAHGHGHNNTTEIRMLLQIIRTTQLPLRVAAGRGRYEPCHPVVVVKYGDQVCTTHVSTHSTTGDAGTAVYWNELLCIQLDSRVLRHRTHSHRNEVLEIHVYDEVTHTRIPVNQIDHRVAKNTSVVHKNHRWLASTTIPLSTILFNGHIDTHLPLHTLPINIGYINAHHVPQQPSSTAHTSTTIAATNTNVNKLLSHEPTIWLYASFTPPMNSSVNTPYNRYGGCIEYPYPLDGFNHRIVGWCEQTRVMKSYTYHRFYQGTVYTLYHVAKSVIQYISPIQPPIGMEKPQIFTHFVSCIPTYQDNSTMNTSSMHIASNGGGGGGGTHEADTWCTANEMICMRIGSMAEHAILLCNYYAYSDSLMNSRVNTNQLLRIPTHHTYVVCGYDSMYQRGYYVLHAIYSEHSYTAGTGLTELLLINPLTGVIHNLLDDTYTYSGSTSCTLYSVGTVFDAYNIYLNIQQDVHPYLISWNFSDYKLWQQCFETVLLDAENDAYELRHNNAFTIQRAEQIYQYNATTIQSTSIQYKYIPIDYYRERGKHINQLVIQQFTRWRNDYHLPMQWNTSISTVLHAFLPCLEHYEQQQIDYLELEKNMETLKQISAIVYTTGINTNDTGDDDMLSDDREVNSILQKIYSLNLHEMEEENIRYSIATYIHPYPNKLGSIWIYMAVSK